jgi:hypothetical protein
MYWLFDFFFWFKKKKKIIKGSKNWESEVSSEIDLKYFLGEVFGQPNIAFKKIIHNKGKILHPISADSKILIFEKSDSKNRWFWLCQNPQRTPTVIKVVLWNFQLF